MPKVLTRDVTPEVSVSPALSLFARPGDGSIRTRRVAILVADGCDGDALVGARRSADARRRGPALRRRRRSARCSRPTGDAIEVDVSLEAAPAVLYDALVLAGRCRGGRRACAPTAGRSNSSRTSTATASRSSRWARASSCSRHAGSIRRCPTGSRIPGCIVDGGREHGGRRRSSPRSPSIGTSPEKPIRRACETARQHHASTEERRHG